MLLQAAKEFANRLGLSRVVLSALPIVVPYYHKTHDYRLCSRTGMDCSYLTRKFRFKTETSTDSGKKVHTMNENGKDIDIYETHELLASDLRLPSRSSGYEVRRPRVDRVPISLSFGTHSVVRRSTRASTRTARARKRRRATAHSPRAIQMPF